MNFAVKVRAETTGTTKTAKTTEKFIIILMILCFAVVSFVSVVSVVSKKTYQARDPFSCEKGLDVASINKKIPRDNSQGSTT